MYLHGAPGSEHELALFSVKSHEKTGAFTTLDRRQFSGAKSPDTYLDSLVQEIEWAANGEEIALVGFSLGGCLALRIAARTSAKIARIDLISAPSPVPIDAPFADMAGQSVFALARRSPIAFAGLSIVQSDLARLSARTLAKAMFKTATISDAELFQEPHFSAVMRQSLKLGLSQYARSYRHEVALYVADWGDDLNTVKTPVRIFHGSQDNWSPVHMALHNANRLDGSSKPQIYPGLSHYSTLKRYLNQQE